MTGNGGRDVQGEIKVPGMLVDSLYGFLQNKRGQYLPGVFGAYLWQKCAGLQDRPIATPA